MLQQCIPAAANPWGRIRGSQGSSLPFQHPLDKAATENLAKVKGIDLFTKKFLELGLEKTFPIKNIGSCLRVSEPQVPSIYRQYIED